MAASGLMDFNTASMLIGRVMTGNVSMLSRYGITLDEAAMKEAGITDNAGKAAYAMEKLNTMFGGVAAANVASYSGRVSQLGNYFGDVKEAIGDVLLPSLTKLTEKFVPVAKAIEAFIKTHPMVTTMALAVTGLATALTALSVAINLINVSTLIAIGKVLGPFAAFGAALIGVAFATEEFNKHCEFMTEAQKKAALAAEEDNLAFQRLKNSLDDMLDLTPGLEDFWKTLGTPIAAATREEILAQAAAITKARLAEEEYWQALLLVNPQLAAQTILAKTAITPFEELSDTIYKMREQKIEIDTSGFMITADEYGRMMASMEGRTEEYEAWLREKQATWKETWNEFNQSVAETEQTSIERRRKNLASFYSAWQTGYNSIIDLHMTGTERLQAIMQSFLTTAIAQIGEEVFAHIIGVETKVAATAAGQAQQTAVTAAGSATRKGITVSEYAMAVGKAIATAAKWVWMEATKTAATLSNIALRMVGYAIEGAAALLSAAKSIFQAVTGIFSWAAKIPLVGIAIGAGLVAAMMGIIGAFKHASGGLITGAPGPDRVPAMLTAGEYVINAGATSRNLALLEAINSGRSVNNDNRSHSISINVGAGSQVTASELMRQLIPAIEDAVRERRLVLQWS